MNFEFIKADKQCGQLIIDTHLMTDGIIFAAVAHRNPKRLKLRIIKQDKMVTFDLKNDGQSEIFPLQFGDGMYQIVLYQNVVSNRYTTIGTIYLDVKLKDENACYLMPNQYINYHENKELIQLTQQLCQNKTKNESYKEIKQYIKEHFIYDYIKATTVKDGMLPDIKRTMQKHCGICYDLAAMATAMLRIMGIPTKMVIGHADSQYHAWVEIINGNKKIIYDPTIDIAGIMKVKKYTTERYY